jgi:DNA-binding response OmpR family regulator
MHKILLVEDDSTVLLFLKHCLDTEGYLTMTAENTATAMSWVKETRFDLAVLDLALPDGNGMEICAAIKENPKTRATPVIILTGNSSNNARIQSNLDAQADLFLNKPIDPGDLRKAVKKMLNVSEKKKLLLRSR